MSEQLRVLRSVANSATMISVAGTDQGDGTVELDLGMGTIRVPPLSTAADIATAMREQITSVEDAWVENGAIRFKLRQPVTPIFEVKS